MAVLVTSLAEGRYEEEGWRVRKDGTKFWANVVITPLYDSTQTLQGYSKVTRDLTDRKRAEDSLKKANEDLERRVRERTEALNEVNKTLRHEAMVRRKVETELKTAVRARDEFLSIASHELRTPITPLKLQVQGILSHLRKGTLSTLPPERLEKMAKSIDHSLGRLGRLVDSLLDVARINAGKIELYPEAIDVSAIISEICQRLEPEAHAVGSHISVDVPKSIPAFFDPMRLEQVITNLTVNSIKYGNGSPISVSATKLDDHLVIQVKDAGIGIAADDIPRIFNQFEQIGRKAGASGLGLGLYITKQIVESQNGKIEVESLVGQGTTFVVKLPIKILEKGHIHGHV